MRFMVKCISATVLIIVSSAVNPLSAASFDCKKASNPIEKLICSDSQLGSMDEEVATTYRSGLDFLKGPARVELIQRQRDWVKARNAACPVVAADLNTSAAVARKTACLASQYSARLEALAAFLEGAGEAQMESRPVPGSAQPVPPTSAASIDGQWQFTGKAVFPDVGQFSEDDIKKFSGRVVNLPKEMFWFDTRNTVKKLVCSSFKTLVVPLNHELAFGDVPYGISPETTRITGKTVTVSQASCQGTSIKFLHRTKDLIYVDLDGTYVELKRK